MSLRARPSLVVLVVLCGVAALVAARAWVTEDEPRYRTDQCTSWVFSKRPDLTVGTAGLAAGEWERWARDNGFRVDTTPRQGAVAAWSRNVGAGPDGHVAYVERVTRAGAVFVSERNLDGCVDVAFVRLTPERQSTAVFIHR